MSQLQALQTAPGIVVPPIVVQCTALCRLHGGQRSLLYTSAAIGKVSPLQLDVEDTAVKKHSSSRIVILTFSVQTNFLRQIWVTDVPNDVSKLLTLKKFGFSLESTASHHLFNREKWLRRLILVVIGYRHSETANSIIMKRKGREKIFLDPEVVSTKFCCPLAAW